MLKVVSLFVLIRGIHVESNKHKVNMQCHIKSSENAERLYAKNFFAISKHSKKVNDGFIVLK